ncbi:MAG TPA: hypothetical protein VLF66_09200, partial [Thermoanaerobaculia bacterium]|nr:hypothetical protein [Thermoanaerobaculia bacterium]
MIDDFDHVFPGDDMRILRYFSAVPVEIRPRSVAVLALALFIASAAAGFSSQVVAQESRALEAATTGQHGAVGARDVLSDPMRTPAPSLEEGRQAAAEALWMRLGFEIEGHLGRIDPALRSGSAGIGRGGPRELARRIDSVVAAWKARRGRGPGAPPGAEEAGLVPEPVVAVLERISRKLPRSPVLGRGADAPRGLLLRDLLSEVRELGELVEKYGRGAEAPNPRWNVSAKSAPANDNCSNATAIGEGSHLGTTEGATNDGTASCGASGTSPDVWFVYTASTASEVVFDTFGSGYDTVLSLHSGCPGTTANELQCNDDHFSLQSRVTHSMSFGEQVWIRVSGFSGATGPFVLNVQEGGRISGTVTDSSTTDPLPGVEVDIFDSSGSFVNFAFTESDGT